MTRTRDQIIQDCEDELERLRHKAELRRVDPLYTHPCTTCRFFKGQEDSLLGWDYRLCTEPLVQGFGQPHQMYHSLEGPRTGWQDDAGRTWVFPKLCGPEKALWRPRLSLWQKFIKLLTEGVNT